MLINFLRKQSDLTKKKKVLLTMIKNIKISEDQKELYIKTLDILDEKWLDNLYKSVSAFVEEVEMIDIKNIAKNNFSSISWIRKKEAIEKQKDINSFSFLLSNI